MKAFVPLAFVVAVGGVGFDDVAVAGFEHFIDAGLVYGTRADVVGQCSEEDAILAQVTVEGAEFPEIFAEKCIGFALTHLVATEVFFAG